MQYSFIRNWIIYRIGKDPPNVFLKCRLNFISNKASIIHLFCYTWSNKCITLCAKKVIPHLVKKDFQISFHFKHSKGLVSLSSKMIPEYFSRKISLNVLGRFVLWCNVINYECISFFQCTISTSWSYSFTTIWDFSKYHSHETCSFQLQFCFYISYFSAQTFSSLLNFRKVQLWETSLCS